VGVPKTLGRAADCGLRAAGSTLKAKKMKNNEKDEIKRKKRK